MATLIKVSAKKAEKKDNKNQIKSSSSIIGLLTTPPPRASNGASSQANYSFRKPTVQKQSLSLIRERNEVLQNVIGLLCSQIARQLPIRTFIDNMWISTKTRRLSPMETPLLGLSSLPMCEDTKCTIYWPSPCAGKQAAGGV